MEEQESNEARCLELIPKLRLMDDDFLKACMQDNKPGVQLILRIVLRNKGLVVTRVVTQREMKNLVGHSLELDVYAEDEEGKLINAEIQRKDAGAVPERAVYHSSMLDANSLPAGEKNFQKKAETYMIMITEHDVLGGGLPIYHVERTVLEMENALFGGKSHIIYVNGSYKGDEDTELRWLIHDLLCTDPDEMHFPELAERVRYHKEDSEGVKAMCKIMEDIEKKGIEKGRMEMLTDMILSMLRRKKKPALIAEDLEISLDMVLSTAKAHKIPVVQ
jgi:hypothetical protein